MAIDLCSASDSSGLGMSPRISFSHDLRHSDVVPVEEYCHRSDGSLLDSSFDFDFGVSASFEQEPPFSADELFFDGKILPCEIREKIQIVLPSKQNRQAKLPPLPPLPLPLPLFPPPSPTDTTTTTTTTMLKTSTKTDDSKKESLKEIMAMSNESEDKASSKSFWRFKRSSSLNAGNGQRRSLICSLPLLSRSNSTGSSTNSKRQPLLKDTQKHSHKPPTPTPAKSSSSFSSSSSQSQKPPMKKNSGSYGNGVRISPVLNIPPPYIAKGTASLFGLGSFFCGGKEKNKKK